MGCIKIFLVANYTIYTERLGGHERRLCILSGTQTRDSYYLELALSILAY